MIATIQDAETLRSVGPVELAAYLRGHDWRQVEQIGDRGAVWTQQASEGEEYEILLPLDRTSSEYARRLSEALQTLAVAEERDEIQILRDITTTTADVVRVRLLHGLIEHGTIPIAYGVQMVQETRELLLASACAAVRPRPVYQSRKPQEAIDYMSGLRMGQTEEGSYVVTIQSPVTPLLHQESLFPERRESQPFERRVLLRLADALGALRRSVASAGATGDFRPFQDAVASGVSANLCDALVGLSMDHTAEEVVMQISWSPTRHVTEVIPDLFRFGRDAFPVLREAARLLRESSPVEDFHLFGTVTSLRREDYSKIGQVTVAALIENDWRKVRMELNEKEYEAAVRAHQEKELVQCVGELLRQGRSFYLQNVREFRSLGYPADDVADDDDPFADENVA